MTTHHSVTHHTLCDGSVALVIREHTALHAPVLLYLSSVTMLRRLVVRLSEPSAWLPQHVACAPWDSHLPALGSQQGPELHRSLDNIGSHSNREHSSQSASVQGHSQRVFVQEPVQACLQMQATPSCSSRDSYLGVQQVQLGRRWHTDTTWLLQQQHWMAGRRAASTLSKAGIPKPRPGVESALSTYKGGHLVRTIRLTQSLRELDMLLGKHADTLTSIHLAAAAKQLEQLFRATDASAYELRVKSIATRIEKAAVNDVEQLPVLNLASILYGLTGSSHAMSDASLTALAAVPFAAGCRQMRLAGDAQWRHIVWGFAMQGYDNPVFWQQLCSTAVPLIPHWSPNCTASVLKNMVMAGVRSDALLLVCLSNMTSQVQQLQPASITDGMYGVASLAVGILKNMPKDTTGQAKIRRREAVREFIDAVLAHALSQEVLERFTVKQLALFMHSLAWLGWHSKDAAAQVGAAVLQGLPNSTTLLPLYAHKLLSACSDMGHQDVRLAVKLAELSTPLLHMSDAKLRQQLCSTVRSIVGKQQPRTVLRFLEAASKLDKQAVA